MSLITHDIHTGWGKYNDQFDQMMQYLVEQHAASFLARVDHPLLCNQLSSVIGLLIDRTLPCTLGDRSFNHLASYAIKEELLLIQDPGQSRERNHPTLSMVSRPQRGTAFDPS